VGAKWVPAQVLRSCGLAFLHSCFFFAFLLRTLALAAAAFCARAVRSAGVMAFAAALPPATPPTFPPWRPVSWKNFRTSGGSFFIFIPTAYRPFLFFYF